MKQLTLSIYELRKEYKRTEKNVLLMRECYCSLYKIGFVDKATMDKVNNTNYTRGV